MKTSNKAVRNGNSVTLTFQGVDVTFEWPYNVLVVAKDSDGEVWAYNNVEIYPSLDSLGGMWCHSDEESFELNESKLIFKDLRSDNWEDSAVEYKL